MLTAILFSVVAVSAYMDIKYHKIFNPVVIIALALGLIVNTFVGPGLTFSLWGMATGFCIFFLPYLLCGMGAGDVKLMAAVGAITGPYFAIGSAIWTGICGAIFVICKALYKKTAGDLFKFTGQYPGYIVGKLITRDYSREELKGAYIPYAPFIALGCIIQFVTKGGLV